jgi:hypothetical protein
LSILFKKLSDLVVQLVAVDTLAVDCILTPCDGQVKIWVLDLSGCTSEKL